MMDSEHRKTLRRFEQLRHLHELTFSCHRRQPWLTNDTWRATDFIWSSVRFHEFAIVDPLLPQLIHPDPEWLHRTGIQTEFAW